jgi:hypothetical protein
MPICNANGLRHAYLLQRLGDGPTLILSNSLGETSRCHRLTGRRAAHGATELTDGDYTVELRSRTISGTRLVHLESSHVSNAEQRFCNALVGLMAAQAGAA